MQAPISRLERALLLSLVAFYALALPLRYLLLQPGFTIFDEQGLVDMVQCWLEGARFPLGFGLGGRLLMPGLGWLCRAAGPSLGLLHLPFLLAALAQAPLALWWLRPRVGERAAAWAALALLVSGMTFAQGRSLLVPMLCPSLLLLALATADRCRQGAQAALWGAATVAGLYLYEGWGLALLALAPYAASQWPWRRLGAAAMGALPVAALLAYGGGVGKGYWLTRSALTVTAAPWWRQALENLALLAGPGHRINFSAVPGLPLPALWTWPLIALGLAAAWRRARWVGWLLLASLPALALHGTDQEPHRLYPLWAALAVLAGLGASNLWSWRKGWGPAACLGLLAFGAAYEAAGTLAVPAPSLDLSYGYSHDLLACARILKAAAPAEGWDLIDGLCLSPDASFRFLLAEAQVPLSPKGRPVALVYWDDRPALDGMAGRILPVGSGGIRPVYLYFPTPSQLPRLRAIAAWLAPLHRAQLLERPPFILRLIPSALNDPACKDPWARTILWEAWFDASRFSGIWDPAMAHRGLAEPLLSGRPYDIAAKVAGSMAPASASALRDQAVAHDPRRAALPVEIRDEYF